MDRIACCLLRFCCCIHGRLWAWLGWAVADSDLTGGGGERIAEKVGCFPAMGGDEDDS